MTLSVSDSRSERYTQQDPDVRLMLQVRDDNAAAFEELVSRYQSRLLTVLQHLLGSRDAAEDLAQEVFLRLFRTRKRYQPEAKFSTYLFTIAHNVARNARRTLARRREVQMHARDSKSQGLVTLEELAQEASGMMPTRQLDKLERAEVVRLAIQALNERQRLALLLCKFEGMSYADIAQTMELSPQAIKSLLSRARCNLRDVLEPYLREGHLPSGNGNSHV